MNIYIKVHPHGLEWGRLLFHRKAIGLSPYPLVLGDPIRDFLG